MASRPRPQKNQRATAPETKEPIMLLCWLLRWFWMISINSNSATYQNNRVPHWKNRFDLDSRHSTDPWNIQRSNAFVWPTPVFLLWQLNFVLCPLILFSFDVCFHPFFFLPPLTILSDLFSLSIFDRDWEGLARKWHSLRYSVLESIQESLKGFYLYKICIIASKIQLKLYLGWISKPEMRHQYKNLQILITLCHPRDSHILVCHSPRDHFWTEDNTRVTNLL